MTNGNGQDEFLARDPHWYKDAIIYELHVRAFADSNGDGIGDLNGLTAKLDYLQDLGVTAVWLLPFYPSPLRDGGYDIADYTAVHQSYGTRRDFGRLLKEAHRRGIRVITELVLNHTSSDHPWFQRARRAPAGSKARDFYVWSDSPQGYNQARIIFRDYETSNWAWDPVARAYYWHRFYAHQPDLNFDNPEVQEAMLEVVDFWLGMGVDGLRLDAVPYLFEREDTSCENLPETHAFLKKLRAHVDEKFPCRMLLAEANQWPADAAAYFGEGDECHMNFHFPLMPRMFMAVQLEDSFPIVNILQQTPPIHDTCQWATFLRNHDELTLEMVTDEDRDTMYRTYASDRAMRINLGIRRRLAPLLNVRRKIELMNALLFSLPGTPVLYYGDEIGMGDNVYLGDRDGVRTPMQWSSDRNAGFSRANPQRLYLPVIIDPEYHYEATNVEAQQSNPSSLLWWMKHLISQRQQRKVFGRGSIEFVNADNPRILAFVREWEDDTVLVVANLSRFAQCTELSLERFEGRVPVEMFGRTRFPVVGQSPYFVSMGPHGFFWLALEKKEAESATAGRAPRPIVVAQRWTAVVESSCRAELAGALFGYLSGRRWFRGKSRQKKTASIIDWFHVAGDQPFVLVLLDVAYAEGASELYAVPLGFASELDAPEFARQAMVVRVEITGAGGADGRPVEGFLYDAAHSGDLSRVWLRLLTSRKSVAGEVGQLCGNPRGLRDLGPESELVARPLSAEQSNTSIVYGNRLILKLLRMIEEGPSVEFEMGRFLSQQNTFRAFPRVIAALEYKNGTREPSTVAILQEFSANQGDAWQMSLDALDQYFGRLLTDEQRPEQPPAADSPETPPEVNAKFSDWMGPYIDRIALLGKRTAEMHFALGRDAKVPAFAPEPFDVMHQQSLYQSAQSLRIKTFEMLKRRAGEASDEQRPLIDAVVERAAAIDQMLLRITRRRIEVDRIRTHGDYHLGQVLWTGDDFVIVDFDGEPARTLSQRRFKRCPLRDVAGMIRSFDYVSLSALRLGKLRPDDVPKLAPWARAWTDRVTTAFFSAYLERAVGSRFVPSTGEETNFLLEFYLLEKCVYEVGYELNNRPDWLEVPLRGILRLVGAPI